MINKMLRESFSYTGAGILELFNHKLELSGFTKTQFSKLSGIEIKSLNAILENTSKQTDIVKLLKVAEFLELGFEEFLTIYFKERPSKEIKELQRSEEHTSELQSRENL